MVKFANRHKTYKQTDRHTEAGKQPNPGFEKGIQTNQQTDRQ